MNAIWPDLTAKIEPIHRQALRTVAHAAAAVGIEWFLTGAMARDWIFELIPDIDPKRKPKRATKDADIGIAISGWDEFERIHSWLIASGEFSADRALHRLKHCQLQGFHIDLVPFGRLGGEKAEIAWPPTHDIVMNVIGFDEAFRAAITVLVDPNLPVKLASPAGLMLMKIFAWEDRKYREGLKDAIDIRHLLTHYEMIAGRSLWAVEGLMEMENHNANRAATRLFGRDVAAIMTQPCRASLLSILDRELSIDSAGLFIEQISRGGSSGSPASDADDFRKMRALLASFRGGLDD